MARVSRRAVAVSDGRDLPAEAALAEVRRQPPMEGRGLVAQVSPEESYVYCEGGRVRVAREPDAEHRSPRP